MLNGLRAAMWSVSCNADFPIGFVSNSETLASSTPVAVLVTARKPEPYPGTSTTVAILLGIFIHYPIVLRKAASIRCGGRGPATRHGTGTMQGAGNELRRTCQPVEKGGIELIVAANRARIAPKSVYLVPDLG
jgi:hypothetical protein